MKLPFSNEVKHAYKLSNRYCSDKKKGFDHENNVMQRQNKALLYKELRYRKPNMEMKKSLTYYQCLKKKTKRLWKDFC